MRLFFAVNFDGNVKRKLTVLQNTLRAHTLRGNFTQTANLHLTLAFIGEVSPVAAKPLFEIAEAFQLTLFQLQIRGVGSFRREGGSIVWAGIEEDGSLLEAHERLSGQLAAAGFRLEERRFTPHLTLAREVRFREGFDLRAFSDTVAPIDAVVTRISLMKSERLGGRLVYTEVG